MTASLARQLIRKVLWLSLVGLLGLGGVVTLSLIVTLQQVQQRLERASLTAANDFDDVFLKLESDLLATSTSLASNGDIRTLLGQMRSRNRYLRRVQLLDNNGQVLIDTGRGDLEFVQISAEEKESLQREINEVYISPINLERNPPSVAMATSFTDELGISQGILVTQVDLTELERQVIQQRVGRTGSVYILNEEGQIVTTSQLHWRGKAIPHQPFSTGFSRLRLRRGLNDKLVFTVQQPLNLVPWSAVVELSVTEAIQPAIAPTAITTTMLLFGSWLIIHIFYFSRRQIIVPLQQLNKGMEQFKTGRIPQLKPINADNELGQLTIAFQDMAVKLQSSLDNLELMVEERATQLEVTTQSLMKSEIQFRQTFQLAPIGMALISVRGDFLLVNQALSQLLDLSEQELLSQNLSDILEPSDAKLLATLVDSLSVHNQTSKQCELNCWSKARGLLSVVLNLVLIRNPNKEEQPFHLIAQIVDITDRKKAEERLSYEALHDHLTGLANRSFFVEVIEQSLRKVRRHDDYLFAVLFLDLDRFKMVNDSLGHNMGDELLILIAQRLRDSLREEDMIARIGGDEFAILLENIGDRQEVIIIVERILASLEPLFNLGGHQVSVGASIGIAFSSKHYASAKDMLRDADIAMYQMKKTRAGGYTIFHEGMYNQTVQRLSLESQIRQALDDKEFFLQYQPILNLQTQMISGFEALVRWQKSDGTIISPGTFIPVAEESGLIIELGAWIIEQVCRDIRHWQSLDQNFKNIEISINVASNQLQHIDFLRTVDDALSVFNVAQNLKFELTESMLMDSKVVTLLHQLKQRQIKLSIDDFGTGYSSLRYLQNFPVDSLKIDRSFVDKMEQTQSDMEVVRAIISLAHNFGLDVVAEGIETVEQMRILSMLGCQFGQGFLFSKPLDSYQVEIIDPKFAFIIQSQSVLG